MKSLSVIEPRITITRLTMCDKSIRNAITEAILVKVFIVDIFRSNYNTKYDVRG